MDKPQRLNKKRPKQKFVWLCLKWESLSPALPLAAQLKASGTTLQAKSKKEKTPTSVVTLSIRPGSPHITI